MNFPETPMAKEEIFNTLEAYKSNDIRWKDGRVLGYIYDPGKAAQEIGKQAYMMFLTESGLDPTIFPSLMRMETELVSMAAAHVGGDGNAVGNFTSGGTESILLAVKTARDYCRAAKPHIKNPEMLLPVTAHAAFHKAGEYFNVKVVPTPVDPVTFKADVRAMEEAVTSDTILMVGSAPSYAHGVVDPIPQMGEVALKHNILLHTDGCVGGFMLPFLKELGESVTDFGFDVPGVTSLSMDLHKYAYTPKNASLILYRDKALRHHQIFATAGWTGYSIVNNAIQSSKTGGPLAAAWAVVHFLGRKGYLEMARATRQATLDMAAGVRKIKDLKLLADPEMFMCAVTSDHINVFHVIDEMKQRGWYIQPQLAFDVSPKNFHVSVNMSTVPLVNDFLVTLEQSVDAAKDRKQDSMADLKALLAGLKPGDINPDNISDMMALAGISPGGGMPSDMAEINEILNSLSREHREIMMKGFMNNLFTLGQG